MIYDRIFGSPILDALKKGLQGASIRHQAIANNLANVSTPGYQRQVVKFEDELWRALNAQNAGLNTTHPKHFNGGSGAVSEVRPQVELDTTTLNRVDQNNVTIEQELVEMMKNSGQFAQRAEILNRLYGQIKTAIRGESV